MDQKDQDRHGVERLMRRAQEAGHDPQRVARALGHAAAGQAEYQPTMDFTERPSLVRRARSSLRR